MIPFQLTSTRSNYLSTVQYSTKRVSLQLYPVYLLWNRRKTLTASLDPMRMQTVQINLALPHASMTPLVHSGVVASRHTLLHTQSRGFIWNVESRKTPWMRQHSGLQYALWWVRPTQKLNKVHSALNLSTLVVRVHASTHALSRSGLWIV